MIHVGAVVMSAVMLGLVMVVGFDSHRVCPHRVGVPGGPVGDPARAGGSNRASVSLAPSSIAGRLSIDTGSMSLKPMCVGTYLAGFGGARP